MPHLDWQSSARLESQRQSPKMRALLRMKLYGAPSVLCLDSTHKWSSRACQGCSQRLRARQANLQAVPDI